jgi:hypothetical protein
VSLAIFPDLDGPTTFNGNAWANGTASFLITPGDGEQIGDPVYVNAEVDLPPTEGTATATLTLTTATGTLTLTPPFSGPSQILAHIGDTLGASASANADLSGSAGPQLIGAAASVYVLWTLTPAPLPGQPTITTTASEQGNVVGSAVLSDTASLTGGYNPTGTITFTLTAPDGTTTPEGSVTVTGDGTYGSPTTVTATEVGTYTWHASYSGDADNNAASDQGGTGEQTVVSPASPTIRTTPSVTNVTLGTTAPTLKDTADLEGGYSPTGTITFTLYQGSILVDTETATVSGNGMYTTPTGYTLPTTGTVTGSYQWDASYNGDGKNNTVSDTNNANEQVVVSPASPMITATASPSSITLNSTGPQVFSDSATLSGGYYPSGNISFTLFGPNDDIVYTTQVYVTTTNTYNAR